MIKYSETEIDSLVKEPKPLSANWNSNIRSEYQERYITKSFEVKGIRNNIFRVIWKQIHNNPSDYAAVFGVLPLGSNTLFRLRRYDGKKFHTNPIEKERFNEVHIHMATERYQKYGTKNEDTYAVPTDRFSNLTGALDCLFKDCCFQMPDTTQLSLLL